MARAGLMRREFFPDKFAPPTFYADQEEIDEYTKYALLDSRPEAPLFEHEFPRKSTETERVINLRTFGQPYRWDPDHPDLFLGESERDPRGQQMGPDWYKYTDQLMPRFGYYAKTFTDDGGTNDVSGVIEPQDLANKMRASRVEFKDRYKNLEDSYTMYTNLGAWPRDVTPASKMCYTTQQCALGPAPNSFEGLPDRRVLFSNIFETRKQLQTDHLLPQAYPESAPRTMKDVSEMTHHILNELDDKPAALLEMTLQATKFPVPNPYDYSSSRREIVVEGSKITSAGTEELQNVLGRMRITPADAISLLGLMALTNNDQRFKDSTQTFTQIRGLPTRDEALKYLAELTAKESPNVQLEMKKNLRQLIRNSPMPASAAEKRMLMGESIMSVNPRFVSYLSRVVKGKTPDGKPMSQDVQTEKYINTPIDVILTNKATGKPGDVSGGRRKGAESAKRNSDSKTVFNYGNVLPKHRQQASELTHGTGRVSNSDEMYQQRGAIHPGMGNYREAVNTRDMEEYGYMNRSRGSLPTGRIADQTVTEDNMQENMLNV